MKVKKGDNVKILVGKDKGRSGKVLRALPKANRVIIEGLNTVKKHQRAKQSNQKGQIIDRPMPVHVSNVALTAAKKKAITKKKVVKAEKPASIKTNSGK